jgi:hypothetical protein
MISRGDFRMMIDTGDAYDNRSAARAVADAHGRGASLGSIRRPRLAGTVLGLGKNRGDRTVVRLAFETGGKGRRVSPANSFGARPSSRARTSRRQRRSRHELSPDLRLVEQ